MKQVYVGKIVNTFGIKGELKIVSRFEMPSKVFKVNNKISINEKEYLITNVRLHKNNYLVEVNNLKDINEVEYLIGYDVFFNKEDLNLNEEEYLISELVGFKVMDENDEFGVVTSYDDNKINPLIKVDNKFYIPLKGEFIVKIDKCQKIIYTKNIKGLML